MLGEYYGARWGGSKWEWGWLQKFEPAGVRTTPVEMAKSNQRKSWNCIRPKICGPRQTKTAGILQAFFDFPNHYSQIFQLADRRDAEAAETFPTTFLWKCSPQRASPSPLSDLPSLLMVVCMEDKEKKVGLVWMISLRGVVWRVSVFFVVLSCVLCLFLSDFFFLGWYLRAYDRWWTAAAQQQCFQLN